jgi:hypothetical protein
MKTMKNYFGMSVSAVIMIFFMFLASCSDDDAVIDFNATDAKNVENEAAADAYQEDADDMGQQAVASDGSTFSGSRDGETGGREMGTRPGIKPANDSRFTCATITFEFAADNTLTTPHGYITIDFGTAGCTDARGNVRKGIIKIEFKGRRFLPGSSISTTFVGYSINGIKLEGVRKVETASTSTLEVPKFVITVTGGKAIWPDGTFIERTVNLTRTITLATATWTLTGTASGSNREGKTYQMEITKPLVYKRECALSNKVFMAVEGTKVLTTENKQIIIDYGTGTCDKMVTITINGVSQEVEVNGAGA